MKTNKDLAMLVLETILLPSLNRLKSVITFIFDKFTLEYYI